MFLSERSEWFIEDGELNYNYEVIITACIIKALNRVNLIYSVTKKLRSLVCKIQTNN